MSIFELSSSLPDMADLLFYLSIMGITETKGLPSGVEEQTTINH